MKSTPLIFVLYDGVENSVFEGQVLQPLLERKKSEPHRMIYLVSYEINKPCDEFVMRLVSLDIHFVVLQKNRIWLSHTSLKKLLTKHSTYDSLLVVRWLGIYAYAPLKQQYLNN